MPFQVCGRIHCCAVKTPSFAAALCSLKDATADFKAAACIYLLERAAMKGGSRATKRVRGAPADIKSYWAVRDALHGDDDAAAQRTQSDF